jgi:hypothetical protein
MKVKKVKVFEFDELSDESKERAVRHFRETNVDYEWYESTYEDAEQAGIKITGFDIDRGNYITTELMTNAEDVAKKIISEHGEMCETFKTASEYLKERAAVVAPEFEDGDIDESVYEDIDDEFKRSIGEDYLSMLRQEYEYQTSDEAIIESIEANEYEFTEDGKPFYL